MNIILYYMFHLAVNIIYERRLQANKIYYFETQGEYIYTLLHRTK